MVEPVTITLIITASVSVITLVLQFLQSAKIHDIQISNCMKTTNYTKKSSSSSDTNDKKSKKRLKKKKNKRRKSF